MGDQVTSGMSLPLPVAPHQYDAVSPRLETDNWQSVSGARPTVLNRVGDGTAEGGVRGGGYGRSGQRVIRRPTGQSRPDHCQSPGCTVSSVDTGGQSCLAWQIPVPRLTHHKGHSPPTPCQPVQLYYTCTSSRTKAKAGEGAECLGRCR